MKAWPMPGMQICTSAWPTRGILVPDCNFFQRLQWTGCAQIGVGRAAFPCKTCQVDPFLSTYGCAWKIIYRCMYLRHEPDSSFFGFTPPCSLPFNADPCNSSCFYAFMSAYYTASALLTLLTIFVIFIPSLYFKS